MSLINDALKRASKSDQNRPPEPPPPPDVFIEPVPDKPHQSLVPLLVAGIVVALGLAGWIFWQWWDVENSAPERPTALPVAIEPSNPTPTNAQTAPLPSAPTPPPQAAIPTAAPLPPPVQAEPAWPTDLKLMGIFFGKTNARVIINGRTLGVGDQIDGIRVTKIETDRVSVEWHGKVKELMVE
jgi:hypothetical protein